jgi:hypothetical protein
MLTINAAIGLGSRVFTYDILPRLSDTCMYPIAAAQTHVSIMKNCRLVSD